MADNVTFTNSGTGAVPNATSFRTRQTSGGQHIQVVDVAPFTETAVSGGQYALSVGTSSPTSLSVPSGATHAWVSVDSGGAATGIRWTQDGTSPTATVGHQLLAGSMREFTNLSNVRLLGQGAAATVNVSYHRYV